MNAQLSIVLGNQPTGVLTLVEIAKIDEVLVKFWLAKYLTSLDLTSGCHHIKLGPGTRHKSAFTTIFGKFIFLRMPFVLTQGTAYFIALMQNVGSESYSSTDLTETRYIIGLPSYYRLFIVNFSDNFSF